MPNHVVNIITGPDLTRFVTKNEKDGGLEFDFNQFIPQPSSLVTGSVACHVTNAAEIALGLVNFTTQDNDLVGGLHQSNCIRQLHEGRMAKDFSNEDFESFVSMMRSHRESQYFNWYDWNIANWGTKWGSYDVVQVSSTVLQFETAWSAPHPVIEALSTLLGDEAFLHEWADEDTGHNVGYRRWEQGSVYEEEQLGGEKRGMELAMKLHDCESDYTWDEGKSEYVYNDEVEY